MKKLPDYGKISFDDFDGMKFEEIVPEACPDAIDLLKKFLVYPSKQRISAQQVFKQYPSFILSLIFIFFRLYYIFIFIHLHYHVIIQIYQFLLDEKIVMFMNLMLNEV
jgi:hypothetical protein